MKKCSVCQAEKDLTEYYTRSSRCKDCHNKYTKEHYKNNVAAYVAKAKKSKDKALSFVREAKSKPCMDCKESFPYYVMDFDHRENKEFNISGQAGQISLARIKAEIAKCDVVCSNCHRKRTWSRANATDSTHLSSQ